MSHFPAGPAIHEEDLNMAVLPLDYGPILPCWDQGGAYMNDTYEWVK